MIIDKEQHRAFLLEMFRQVQIPGQHLDFACEVKKAIEDAQVQASASAQSCDEAAHRAEMPAEDAAKEWR